MPPFLLHIFLCFMFWVLLRRFWLVSAPWMIVADCGCLSSFLGGQGEEWYGQLKD